MKSIKKILVGVAYVCSVAAAPLAIAGPAHSLPCPDKIGEECILQPIPTPISCSFSGPSEFPDGNCDLAIDKQVSVNGGLFVEADTSADAAQAHVGDTITWKITVSNASTGNQSPAGTWLYVKDDIPSGFNVTNTTVSAGFWGVYASDIWSLPLTNDESSTLPATMTITSTSTATGLFDNFAVLYRYEAQGCPDGGCTYSDDVSGNNINHAWVDPSGQPVVLADTTTLANTGSGTMESVIAGGLIAVTALTILVGRKPRTYRINH